MIKNVLKKLTVFDDQIDKELLNGEKLLKNILDFFARKLKLINLTVSTFITIIYYY